MKKYETQSGITLIALIITIVVLLILATVTISLTLGERGIFNIAQQAGKNYKEASDKELADLTSLEQEMENAINGTGNGGTTKPEQKPIKLNTLGAEHYGDYVDYPVEIGRGPTGIAETHKSDWRIFYNDGTYVYLIASYLLENSQAPEGIGMSGVEGKPYSTYWAEEPTTYIPIEESVRTNYKMSWNKNETNANIKCISILLDTSKWTKFVNSQYAEDAIGSPTLELWVESWNAKVAEEKSYYSNVGENGYYFGTSANPITTYMDLSNSNNLYYPVRSGLDENGYYYYLASPSASIYPMIAVNLSGHVGSTNYHNNIMSIRPLVRLKYNAIAKQDAVGVWRLQ